MSAHHLYRFTTVGPLEVAAHKLTRMALTASMDSSAVKVVDDTLEFVTPGWYEVLLTVQWDPTNRDGRRFAHTAIPDSHPLHSEAIEADALAELSDRRQLLRGNTWFDPESSGQSLALVV